VVAYGEKLLDDIKKLIKSDAVPFVYFYLDESVDLKKDSRLHRHGSASVEGVGFMRFLLTNESCTNKKDGAELATVTIKVVEDKTLAEKFVCSTADGASSVCHLTGTESSTNKRLCDT
jgi:hypothetical protein